MSKAPIIDIVELKPKKAAIAKAKPLQSSELSEQQVFEVFGDREFKVKKFQTADNGHYKVTLEGEPHPVLGNEVYLWPAHFEEFKELAIASSDTVLKTDPTKQSSELSEDQKLILPKGSSLLLKEVGEIKNHHIKIVLENEHSRFEWWAYLRDDDSHISIEGTEKDNKPKDSPVELPPKQIRKVWNTTKVPGISKLNMYDPVHAELAKNIIWGELLHFDGNHFRCPANSTITLRLIELAKDLQKIRNLYNAPMTINSGYRDPATNRKVGGAKYSQHCQGRACDFTISNVHPKRVNQKLVNTAPFSGQAVASASCFTHYDNRGYRARWSYGF